MFGSKPIEKLNVMKQLTKLLSLDPNNQSFFKLQMSTRYNIFYISEDKNSLKIGKTS